MRSAWVAMVLIGLLAPVAETQENADGFAATAPPKVNVTLGEETGPAEEPGEAPLADDEKLQDIQQAWDAAGTDGATADPDTTGPVTEGERGFSPGVAALKATGALCVVLALVLLLAYLVKRFGKRTPMLAGQQLGQVMGRVALSPQASLHFVRTNGEVLVVGVTQQSISLLRTFDAEDFEAVNEALPEPSREDTRDSSFLDQLKDVQASMGTASPGVDQDLDTLKGDLQRLKQYFQDSARARE